MLIVDACIETMTSREHVAKTIKKFKNERDTVNKKISKCKDKETLEKYNEYLKAIDKCIKKLENYQKTLYRNGQTPYIEATEEEIAINSINIDEFLEVYHKDFVYNMDIALQKVSNYIKTKYNFLITDNAYAMTDIEIIEAFRMADEEKLKEYISVIDNKVYIDLAYILPLNIKSKNVSETEILDILEDICDYVQFEINEKYCVFFEGDPDMYHIHMAHTLMINPNNFNRNKTENSPLLETSAILEGIKECMEIISKKDFKEILRNNIDKYSEKDLLKINEFNNVCKFVNTDELYYLYESAKKEIYRSENLPQNSKYIKASAISTAMYDLTHNTINENINVVDRYTTLYELCVINEFMYDMENVALNETSFINSLKIAKEKLVKNAKKLSDKERLLSNKMDNAIDRLIDKAHKDFSNKNREMVIKGSIIPSFSMIVKLAITSGALYLINPTLSVITVVSSLVMSKKATKREREYVLDEIEIQLKLIDKKMQLAEQNNDMEAMESLLKLERKLKKEKQRIFYKIRANQIPISRD